MVSYDLMDAIKTPPDERVFQHYIYSAGEAVEAFACKVTQVITTALDGTVGDRKFTPLCTLQHDWQSAADAIVVRLHRCLGWSSRTRRAHIGGAATA